MHNNENVLYHLVSEIDRTQNDLKPIQTLVFIDFCASPETIKQWLAFLRMVYPQRWVDYQENSLYGSKVLTLYLYEHYSLAGFRVACRLYGIEGDSTVMF